MIYQNEDENEISNNQSSEEFKELTENNNKTKSKETSSLYYSKTQKSENNYNNVDEIKIDMYKQKLLEDKNEYSNQKLFTNENNNIDIEERIDDIYGNENEQDYEIENSEKQIPNDMYYSNKKFQSDADNEMRDFKIIENRNSLN